MSVRYIRKHSTSKEVLIMKTLFSIAGGAALAVALSLALVSPSAADPAGNAIAGGVLGFMAGAMVGGAAASGGGGYYVYHDSGPRYGGDYSWRRHVRACFRAYGDDYDPGSNTYIDDYGDERRCRL
jgi:hypothetical protein